MLYPLLPQLSEPHMLNKTTSGWPGKVLHRSIVDASVWVIPQKNGCSQQNWPSLDLEFSIFRSHHFSEKTPSGILWFPPSYLPSAKQQLPAARVPKIASWPFWRWLWVTAPFCFRHELGKNNCGQEVCRPSFLFHKIYRRSPKTMMGVLSEPIGSPWFTPPFGLLSMAFWIEMLRD